MSMIEVRATLSFDTFRQGRYYQVDGSDPRIQNQVYAGYFKVTDVPGESLADPVPGGDVAPDLDPGVPGPKKRAPRKAKEVTDEADHLRREGESFPDTEDTAFGQENG